MTEFSLDWKNPDDWGYMRFDLSHFALSLSYFVLIIVAVILFLKFQYSSKIFKIAFLLGSFIRGLYFLIEPFVKEEIVVMPYSLFFFLNTISTFLFFACYFSLLFFWEKILLSHIKTENFKMKVFRKRLRLVLIVLFIGFLCALVILYSLDLATDDRDSYEDSQSPSNNTYETCILLFASSMYIIVSFGFFGYGYFIFRKSFSNKVDLGIKVAYQRNDVLRKLSTITTFCMSCFFLRAAVTLWSVIQPDINWNWWLDIVYYSSLEVVPLVAMLFSYIDEEHATLLSQRDHSHDNIKSPLIKK